MLKFQQWMVSLVLLIAATVTYALPFTIVPYPGISLPTYLQAGQSVSAYYTITNNGTLTLNNNFIKYLPPNVAQVTTDAGVSNLCSASFNLGPKGSTQDTCTLELLVSGGVDVTDPDPHHHLFACIAGGVLCAGTNFGLNVIQGGALASVIVTPLAPIIAEYHTQQFTATAVFTDGDTQDVSALATWTSANPTVATVNSTGLASGLTPGSSTISASFFGITGSTLLTVDQYALVTGNYTTTSGVSYPIAVQSYNDGISWTYSVTSGSTTLLPSTSQGFAMKKTSCSGPLCVSVGSYTTTANPARPNIYAFQTTNAGTTFTNPISGTVGPLPAGYVQGELLGTSCSGANCVVAGDFNNGSAQYPYAAETTNSGNSYAIVVSNTLPTTQPTVFSSGGFVTGTCSASICLAAGQYINTSAVQTPLLAQTVLPSTTWAYAVDTDVLANPPGFSNNGIFNATACNTTNCIAAGSYLSTTTGVVTAPLIAAATGTGTGWAYLVNSLSVPSDYNSAQTAGATSLTGAACGTNACVGVGYYGSTVAGVAQPVPLVYQSINGAAFTITLSNTIGVGPSLPTNDGAQLNAVSCSGTLCVAVGTYVDPTTVRNFPLIIKSTDTGATWVVANNPTAPTGLVSATVNGVRCQGTYCVVSAQYNDGTNTQPFVIQSTDSGTTWTYVVTASTPTKPTDATNIFFSSVSVTALVNNLTHKDFDHQAELKNRLTLPSN